MRNIEKDKMKSLVKTGIKGLATLLICALLAVQSVDAGSSNVAIIGSPGVINGGILPTNIPGITFNNLAPANVNTTNLAGYDTVVLNVASNQIGCNVGQLSASARSDLINFVANGGKLIIYDSECSPQNYNWLPAPFTTNNPGQRGAHGTLTIVEENTLSSNNVASPYYINAAYLGSSTDAVGDMNVMTTRDPNWCLDMSGTNVNRVSGPVHTYTKYPFGTDKGLIIYNGLDMDTIGNPQPGTLAKIWELELKQSFNPSNLPCGKTVVGITLSPLTAKNPAGTIHTVTATISDILGNPQSGVTVNFDIISGPNIGSTGSVVTDVNGNAVWNYTSNGIAGIDTIQAWFIDNGQRQVSQNVTKEWIITNHPPVSLPGGPYVGNEGSPITFDGTKSYDPDAGDSIAKYEWDLNGDGIVDATGPIVTNTWPDDYNGTVTLTVTDTHGATGTNSTTVIVNNVPPTVKINSSYYATVPVTLRIAGQGKVGNSVELQVIQDNVVVASDKIVRVPGSPNQQEVTISATIDLSKPYSGKLLFNTTVAYSGGTPVWVIIDDNMTKVTTFNTQKNDPSSYEQTYDFDISNLVSIVGKEITFKGTATDPGTDGLTFAWAFGDSATLNNSYPWSGSHTVTDTVKHTYTVSGSYTVNLDVKDDDGGVGSDNKTIVVK